MKQIVFLIIVMAIVALAKAQPPEGMSYQAVLRNGLGQPLAESMVGVRISILQGSAEGSAVYSERHRVHTNSNGLVSIVIGAAGADVLAGSFLRINWSQGPYFIQSETDINGGENYTISATSELLNVPYALYAGIAERLAVPVAEVDPQFHSSAASKLTDTDLDKLANLSGTNTGDQNLSQLALRTELADSVAAIRRATIVSETDPLFAKSVAVAITANDTTRWSGKQDQLTAGTGIRIERNVISLGAVAHYPGELFGGGVVFWVDPAGQHGLIVSMVDVNGNAGVSWTGANTLIGAAAQSDWNGEANSSAILEFSGSSASAAGLCLNYVNADYGTGVYNDWYLPSRGELNDLWNQLRMVQKALDTDDNSGTTSLGRLLYWSSTEYNNNSAWYYYFTLGYPSYSNKNQAYAVRAVRAF